MDVLLLDKTGTITVGDRQASAFLPLPGVGELRLAEAACWPAWPTKRPRAARSCGWPPRPMR
jgi:high-affinity K+ transport system ATPase subunit B